MSYSVCIHGGKMCDGCMDCYDRRSLYEDDEIELDDDEEEEEEDDE